MGWDATGAEVETEATLREACYGGIVALVATESVKGGKRWDDSQRAAQTGLAQAGGYISGSKYTFDDYLKVYKERRGSLEAERLFRINARFSPLINQHRFTWSYRKKYSSCVFLLWVSTSTRWRISRKLNKYTVNACEYINNFTERKQITMILQTKCKL